MLHALTGKSAIMLLSKVFLVRMRQLNLQWCDSMPPSIFATLTDFSNQFSFSLEVQIKVKTVGNS